MTTQQALQWRYATKRFDERRHLSPAELSTLMQTVNLTASSYGLQAYRVFVVEDEEIKAQLRAASHDQAQLTEASHIFVFAAKTDVALAYVEAYIERIAGTRKLPLDKVEGFANYIKGSLEDKSPDFLTNWNARQAYTALGTLLAAAAELQIDTCPMEGFVPERYDEILGLTKRGLTAVVICAAGYRSPGDATQHYAKVHLSVEEMFTVV